MAGLWEARRTAVARLAPVMRWRLATALVHGEDGAGERFGAFERGRWWSRQRPWSTGDFEFAEHVGAVGHAGGGDAVGDEDGAVFALRCGAIGGLARGLRGCRRR